MKIWLLSSKKRFDCYENQKMLIEADKRGIDFKILLPEKFEIIVSNTEEKTLYYDSEAIELPDILIPRYSIGYFAQAVIRHLEKKNVIVINNSHARWLAKDKLASLQELAANNFPIPKTILAKHSLDLDLIEKELNYPIILKKTQGSEGKGIVLSRNREELEDLLEMLEDTISSDKTNLILQEFVEESTGKDIRVFVIGGRAIGAMLRQGKLGDFKANYSGGGSVHYFELTPEVEWLAVECARTIGLDIAGVDLLFDKNGYKVCEINASPYFEGFEKATQIDVSEEIFNYLNIRFSKKEV